jgi:hypothetical protein
MHKKDYGQFIINLGAVNSTGYRRVLDNDLKIIGPVLGPDVESYITYIGKDNIVISQEEYNKLKKIENYNKELLDLIKFQQKVLKKQREIIEKQREVIEKKNQKILELNSLIDNISKENNTEYTPLYIGSKVAIVDFPESVNKDIVNSIYYTALDDSDIDPNLTIEGTVTNISCNFGTDPNNYTRDYNSETYSVVLKKFGIQIDGFTRKDLVIMEDK